MPASSPPRTSIPLLEVVHAPGQFPRFQPGDAVRIDTRSPVGHYRVPTYLRGRQGVVQSVVEPAAVDNEEEGYGRNAGSKLHYYRCSFRLADLWAGYTGRPGDALLIEVFETWIEGA